MVDRRVLKTFAGEGQTGLYRRGQVIKIDEQLAREYDNQGLTQAAAGRPSKAAAQASADANKATRASETKEATSKGADGLEAWDGAQSEEAYVARFGGNADNSDAVKEKLKLAKARIRAGVSAGAAG